MSAWLGRQRKGDLVTLADAAGLEDVEGLRKDELAALLDEHLQKNATTLAGNSTLREYYDRSGSPTKRNVGASATLNSDGEIKSVVRARGRRTTKVKEELHDLSEASPSSPPAAITPSVPRSQHLSPAPRRSSAVANVSSFPPSPAVVTDAIEAQSALLSAGFNDLLTATKVEDFFLDIREQLSSVVGVEMTILVLQSFYLQRAYMPWKYAFDIPASLTLGTGSRAVYAPDLFILLTSFYWKGVLLWSMVSFWLPLAASWFWNLTLRSTTKHGVTTVRPKWRFDPFTFNIVKALLTWLVFAQGKRAWGYIEDDTVKRVAYAMPGGYAGMLIGAFIGILASLYEAAQKK